jgi:hypothetical protein
MSKLLSKQHDSQADANYKLTFFTFIKKWVQLVEYLNRKHVELMEKLLVVQIISVLYLIYKVDGLKYFP